MLLLRRDMKGVSVNGIKSPLEGTDNVALLYASDVVTARCEGERGFWKRFSRFREGPGLGVRNVPVTFKPINVWLNAQRGLIVV